MGTAGDRTKGEVEKLGGTIEKGIGKAIGSEKLEAEGRAKELKGEAKEEAAKTAARVQATVEEAQGVMKQGVGALVGDKKMQAEGEIGQRKGEVRHKANE